MPTPVGHSLAALAIHLTTPNRPLRQQWVPALILVVLANLPDIDFLPGYLAGEPRLYHWGPTHSFAAALIAGLLAGLVARRLTGRFLPMALLGGAAYASHVCLDLLLGPGVLLRSMGLQVFWPFSTEPHMAPWSVFRAFPSSIDELGPIRALFTSGVLPLMAREVTILLPVCLVAWIGRRLYRRDAAPEAPDRTSALARTAPADCQSS
ncbi:MAG TPA: metal-dependent hydrolase [Longimicrobiales bacterium]